MGYSHKKDMNVFNLFELVAIDRAKWQKIIGVDWETMLRLDWFGSVLS